MTATIRQAAGSFLIVGLSGLELTSLERAWLKLIRPAGIILFRRNIENSSQSRKLLDDGTALCSPYSFRCVDVEGGTVDRLREALAPMPSAQAVMRAATNTKNMELIRRQGELVARAVRAFGLNTTLAPVLDIELPESASVLGTRAAAATAEGLVEYARGFLAGLAAHGVVACGKHCPGLGGGALDSHLETPEIRRSWRDLWREDLLPYRILSKALPMIMVSHAAYPETPGKYRPASVSQYWIANVLRKRIAYRGVIFSDDLEMGGILKLMTIEEAAIASIHAGMDLLEICHSAELIIRAYEALISEGERSATFRKLLLERAKMAARQRARLFADGTSKALSAKQFEVLRGSILRFGETIQRAQPAEAKST